MYGFDSYVTERDAKHKPPDYYNLEVCGLLGKLTDNQVACGPFCQELFDWRDNLRKSAHGEGRLLYNVENVVAGFRRLFEFGQQYGIVGDVLDDATIYQLIISEDKQTSMGLSEIMRAIPLGFCGPASMQRFTDSLDDTFPMDGYRDEFDMYLFEDACRRDHFLWGEESKLTSDERDADKREYVMDVIRLSEAYGKPISHECVSHIGEMLLGHDGFERMETNLREERLAAKAEYEREERENEQWLRERFGDAFVDYCFADDDLGNKSPADNGGVSLGA
jgi:hypothetical protein